MTNEEIGSVLGLTGKQVKVISNRAMKKLGKIPGSIELLNAAARAVHIENTAPFVACGSVECRHDWISIWGDFDFE